MKLTSLSASMAVADLELQVEIADTPWLVREAHRLRHQVYCLERGYEPGQDGLEVDEYDDHSRHVVLQRRASGEVLGTARLIMPLERPTQTMFAMQEVCGPMVFSRLPAGQTAEVSRFAISKERRGLSGETTGLSRLMLVRGLLALSHRHGITHWCAMMERTLLRLLRASSIHFAPLGPVIEYHGLRQPAACELTEMLARMADEQPAIHHFLGGDALPVHRQMAELRAA